jgi:Signal transduction histidine kinase
MYKRFLYLLILALSLLGCILLLWQGLYPYALLCLPATILCAFLLFRQSRQYIDQIGLFAQTIHYHDFSGRWDERNASAHQRRLYRHFNTIIHDIKQLQREKEVQYQYFQKVLEMVDTGIIAYHSPSGQISWMNEAFKNMFNLPQLSNLSSLEKRRPGLAQMLQSLPPGPPNVQHCPHQDGTLKLLVSLSCFVVDEKEYRLLALQNVGNALDESEIRAWQKLLSVMTHEIMNSVAPISSLADTLQERLDEAAEAPKAEDMADLRIGLETIGRRSHGLLRFAKTYRQLNKIGEPLLESLSVEELFHNLTQLLAPGFAQKGIAFHCQTTPSGLRLSADPGLLEQALINLLTNAMEAVSASPHKQIRLSARHNAHGRVCISVGDSGCGIPPELLDRIFIPFFSARPGGSGIGLTLCQQIMLMHKGKVSVRSKEDEGSVFTLEF